MKAILTVLLVAIIWSFVGHFYPVASISLTALLLPVTFFYSKKVFGKSVNGYVYSLFGFGVVLLNDYLFRIFGGGLHDDAGRGICEIVFYATLLTSTISLAILQMQGSERGKVKVYSTLFIMLIASITFLIFRNYNVFI